MKRIYLASCFISFFLFILVGCNEIEKSKESAIEHLNNNKIEKASTILLDYINRAYGTKIDYSTSEPEGDIEKAAVNIYIRLSEPDKTVAQETIEKLHYSIDRLTATALYCDKFPLKNDFFETMDKYIDIDGYTLTHSGIALHWAIENDCLDSEKEKLYSEKIKKRLLEYIGRADNYHSKVITAIAVLAYMGESSKIKKEWINKITACQNKDGGWPDVCKYGKESKDNTTAFALWAILAYEQKNVKMSWIRKKKAQ